ncbi:MAG: DUF370 domain-containing protein [Firmicutes bacterium]|nr:DUF370 domain-containing protein [Bacillota bacterium]
MFLHLGGCVVVPLDEVVAICQIRRDVSSPDTTAFIRTAEEEGFLTNIPGGQASSVIVTTRGVYLSSISAATLNKRAKEPTPWRQQRALGGVFEVDREGGIY